MKMYRIISLSKKFKIVKSPFVFLKEDAGFKCEKADKDFKNSKHIMVLSQKHTAKEIRYVYPENISFSELEAIVKGLKNNEMPIL